MGNSLGLFWGMVFWGSEYLPGDIILSLTEIRKWAFEHGLIADPDFQLITEERVKELKKVFSLEDKLMILIYLDKDEQGELFYLEGPFVPVATLIKRRLEIDLVWWQMRPTITDRYGNVKEYGYVRFGFWIPGVTEEELYSESMAKIVTKKFRNLTEELNHEIGGVRELPDNVLDVEVDGAIKAFFFKRGRYYDVKFSFKGKFGN